MHITHSHTAVCITPREGYIEFSKATELFVSAAKANVPSGRAFGQDWILSSQSHKGHLYHLS